VVMFCQLDVTGRTHRDPAAERIARNVLECVDGYKSAAVRNAIYVGEVAGKTYLEATAGIAVKAYEGGALGESDVLVIGPGGGEQLAKNAPAVAQFVKAGGHVIAIGLDERDAKSLPFKISTKSSEYITTTFDPFAMTSPLRGVGPADLDNRDPRDIPLITGGATTFGNGVLAVVDHTNVVLCQLAPWQFDYENRYNLKRTYRRASYAVVRLLANAGVSGLTPVLSRLSSPVAPAKPEKRYLDGLYIDKPEEWDDPYRFFCW